MKKRLMTLVLVGTMAVCSLTACSFEKTCKADGCTETELYKDGYCKYHYYVCNGESIIKDVINGK